MKTILTVGSIAALTLTVAACGQKSDANTPATFAQVAQAGSAGACKVQGVWSLDSVFADGKPQPNAAYKQMKIISGSHYSWVGQDGGQMPLVTAKDSLTAYRTRGAGGGSYRVTDSSYIEHLDFFSDPSQIGRDVTISCRMAGSRWEAAFDWPVVENGKSRSVHIQEIWRRVE